MEVLSVLFLLISALIVIALGRLALGWFRFSSDEARVITKAAQEWIPHDSGDR